MNTSLASREKESTGYLYKQLDPFVMKLMSYTFALTESAVVSPLFPVVSCPLPGESSPVVFSPPPGNHRHLPTYTGQMGLVTQPSKLA